ncbi:MAG: CdaR family protein [Anaerolineaceae bacterium]|nr:CdaR family protein [Anaerolineaceae bacterium]
MQSLRNLAKQLPTFLTAFVLALAIWVIAVNSNDPSVQKTYPSTVSVQVVGQEADMVMTSSLPNNISLTLRAPNSVWTSLIDEKVPVTAVLDLSGLGEGQHTVPIQIEVGIRPVEVISYSPRSIDVTLEPLGSNQFDINVVNTSGPPIGYQAGSPILDQTKATVSGAVSEVNQVTEIRASLDLSQVQADISEEITLKAYDAAGNIVKGVSISPEKVTVNETITQLGGFRNVVVKVVTTGQVATGYRLAAISVNPPTVTVFSTDPTLVEALPGYVETDPISLAGLKDNLTQQIGVRVPAGVTLVGDPSVSVQVSVAAIESSVSLTNIPVEATGLASNMEALISPDKVDLIVSGPLVALNAMNTLDLRVLIDLSGMKAGTYTITPTASLNNVDLAIESLLPTTFQVTIYPKGTTPPK